MSRAEGILAWIITIVVCFFIGLLLLLYLLWLDTNWGTPGMVLGDLGLISVNVALIFKRWGDDGIISKDFSLKLSRLSMLAGVVLLGLVLVDAEG